MYSLADDRLNGSSGSLTIFWGTITDPCVAMNERGNSEKHQLFTASYKEEQIPRNKIPLTISSCVIRQRDGIHKVLQPENKVDNID